MGVRGNDFPAASSTIIITKHTHDCVCICMRWISLLVGIIPFQFIAYLHRLDI